MTVNAIIAEYNPLHKGHEYLINRAKELTGADYTIVVMSGDFVQRGEPAIMDKTIRTKAALMAGADLVIELPLYYSMSSAEYFAKGAVALIDKLGFVDNLVFGCENDNIDLLEDIAYLSLNNEKEYYELIVNYMSLGNSYPKAESMAIYDILTRSAESVEDDATDVREEYRTLMTYSREEVADILAAPNSTLAICYIKSIISLNSNLNPIAINRIVSDYNDLSLGALSSSAVRKEILEENYTPLKHQLSEDIYELMAENLGVNYPIFLDDYSDLLIYKLRSLIYGKGSRIKSAAILALTEYLDVSEALAGRIINCLSEYKNFSQFVALLKTKSVTYSHISRALMHIVLDIKRASFTKYINNDFSLYVRILGFYSESQEILSMVKNNSRIPVISKLADVEEVIENPLTLKLFYESINASEIYSSISSLRLGSDFVSEFSKQIVIL